MGLASASVRLREQRRNCSRFDITGLLKSASALAPSAPTAFRLAPRPTPRPNTRPTATPKEPNALQHHSGQRQRLGDSSARRQDNDEGEEFPDPPVTAAATYAQISHGFAAPIGSFGVHL